jgi:hypothetical protein
MRRCALSLAMVVGVAAPCAAAPALTGRVYTQGKAERVVARLWASGEPIVADPAKAGRPLAEAVVAPGQSFALDLENAALPVRVELAAPGHVGLAFDVLFPEQLQLPPAWLPEGTSVAVGVSEDGKPAVGASVWGRLPELGGGDEPGRWRMCVPRSDTGTDGRVTVWVRRNRGARLWAARGGRWGALEEILFSRGELTMRLASRQVAVRVVDRRGGPVNGARVAAAGAPVGLFAVTGDDGRATVPALTKKEWTLVAVGPGLLARRVLHGPAKGAVELVAEPPEVLEVQWTGPTGPVGVDAEWVPAALRGGAPLVATMPARLPFLGGGGPLQLWRPGVARWDATVDDARAPLVARLERTATVTGTVTEEGGRRAAGVPVWVWGTPEWQRRGGRIVVRGSGRAILERAPLPWAVTDESGSFTLPDVAPGPAKVSAWRADRPEAESDDLRLAAGASQRVALTLEAGSWLALTAIDSDGRRLGGVTVEVQSNREARRAPGMFRLIGGGDESAQAAATGSTDRDGRITVPGVPRGPVGAVLTLAGFVPRTVEAEVPAEGIDLGEQVLEPGVAVQGRVVDERGQGVGDAEVIPDPHGMGFLGPGGVRADAQGFFVLADQPRVGELQLSARGEGFASVAPQLVRLPPAGPVELKVRRTRSLDGLILARESGEPVAGTRIGASRRVERGVGGVMRMSSAMQVAEAESDEAGRFRLDGLTPIELTVYVEAREFRSRSIEVDLGSDGAPRELTVIIERGLAIRGVVIDASGAPFAGASVQAMPAEGGSGISFSTPGPTRTGPDGRFEIAGVAAGRWQVTAEAEGGLRAQEVVEAGGEEVELRLEGGGTIRGRVTTPGGAPSPDARVTAWGSGGWNGEQAPAANGSFEFTEVPAGTARVSARAKGLAGSWKAVQVTANAVAEVELALEAGGIVRGRIKGLSQEQLGRCNVSGGGASASPAADGTFTLEGVRPGRSEVSASLFPEGLHRAVPVEIADIALPVEVEIDFARGIAVSGSVRRAGEAAQGLAVQVAAAGGRGVMTTATDEAGRFEIKGVEPGTLTVSVADDRGRTLASRTIAAESDTRVDLEVPTGELIGRVVAAGSRDPIADGRVTARLQGEELARSAATDDDGAFRLEELPDGTYLVRAEATGYGAAEVAAPLSMGRARDVVLELPAEQGLVLSVRQPDGSVPSDLFIQPMRDGRVEDGVWARCDRKGTARVTSLPAGAYVFLMRGGQSAALVQASVPSPEISVRLEPTGRLEVLTPTVPGWRVRVATASGLVVPPSNWLAPRRDGWTDVGTGRIEQTLPAGAYFVEVVSPAGASQQKSVLVTADGRAAVAFE